MSNTTHIPFEATIYVRDHCLCLHAQRAARALARTFDKVLKPFGLTNGQFSLLMSLNRPHPPAMGSVASLLAMDRTTLTAALKPLEKQGWVSISPDPADKRNRLLVLTEAGKAALSAALPVWCETHMTLESKMPQGEADRLRQDLLLFS
jgi:DNA-binding MarR family transcriptional regulator